MLWPKRNSYKEVDNEKNSCGLKIPHPPPLPITFLMVRPFDIRVAVAVIGPSTIRHHRVQS